MATILGLVVLVVFSGLSLMVGFVIANEAVRSTKSPHDRELGCWIIGLGGGIASTVLVYEVLRLLR